MSYATFKIIFTKGTVRQKQSAVPLSRLESLLLGICLSRVQESKNAHLYPYGILSVVWKSLS